MNEIVVTRLTPLFAAQIDGVDITRALDERTWTGIRSAVEEHSVLVFRGSHIEGLPMDEGRALLKELLDHATQSAFVDRHDWREGDLVVWDNRCVLHRATPFDSVRHKRLMQRTTISGDPAELARATE